MVGELVSIDSSVSERKASNVNVCSSEQQPSQNNSHSDVINSKRLRKVQVIEIHKAKIGRHEVIEQYQHGCGYVRELVSPSRRINSPETAPSAEKDTLSAEGEG